MMIWTRRILLTLIVFYVAICAVIFFAQRKFLYFPPNIYHAVPAGFSEIRTQEGYLGWYSPAQNGQRTVMVFHGNASSIDSNLHIFRDLKAQGYGVWSVGYPGYPGNAGPPTQKNIMAAATSQYETLRESGVSNIVFYGTSLGSGVASQLAATHQPDLLILDAPFNSAVDMATRQMPFLPTRLLMKDRWDSGKVLDGLNVPLLWIHGTADGIIPVSQGRKLFDPYVGPKSAYIINNAHHTNTWIMGGRDRTLTALGNLENGLRL